MKNFEERLARLEEISEKLRNGKIPIDEATVLFEEGMKLSRSLDHELQQMERRIEILTTPPEATDEGPELELFEETEKRNPDSDPSDSDLSSSESEQ